MPSVRSYYEGQYAEHRLDIDLKTRRNRLAFCLSPSLSGMGILDVGCGPGAQLAYLIPHNEVYGIDISSVALALAAGNGYRPVLGNLDGCALPFPDGAFDIVVCTDLLEHLFSPGELLKEIRRVLKPNGKAIISVPNHFDLFSRWRLLRGKGLVFPYHRPFRTWDYCHLRFFLLGDFLDLLREMGLSVQQTYYEFSPAGELALVLSMTDRGWMRDWASRHRHRVVYTRLVRMLAACVRLAVLPRMVAQALPRLFPRLFSGHFLVRCAKSPDATF